MAFPTSPVSADAVLLMTAHVVPPFAGGGLGRMLVQGVARDLTKRGIKAIEAFGDAKFGDGGASPAGRCLAPADFFLSVGFKTVRPHPRFPRLRLELRTALSLEVRRRVRAGEAARLDEPGDAAAAGPPARSRRREPRRLTGLRRPRRPGRAAATRSVARAGGQPRARSSLTSIEPVGTSCSIGKYIRCTAATIASTTRSRNRGSISRARSSRRGQVADLDPDRRHPGQPQQVPRLGVGAAVAQPGAGDDLALHQPGQPLPGRRGDAVVGAVVVGGDPVGLRVGVAVEVQRDEQVGAELVGELRRGRRPAGSSAAPARGSGAPACRRRRAAPPAGWPGRGRGRPRSSAADRRGTTTPGSVPPWPGSMTTAWPTRVGPDCRIASDSRSHCGRPPTTLRPSRRSASIVCGPQEPSGVSPTSRWNWATAPGGADAVDAVGAARRRTPSPAAVPAAPGRRRR